MTQSDQDAVIGRVVRERSEVQKQVDLLTAEASRLGRMLEDLGQRLQRDPAHVIFDGQSADMEYFIRDGRPSPKASDVQGDKLAALVEDLRKKLGLLKGLQREASSLGV